MPFLFKHVVNEIEAKMFDENHVLENVLYEFEASYFADWTRLVEKHRSLLKRTKTGYIRNLF